MNDAPDHLHLPQDQFDILKAREERQIGGAGWSAAGGIYAQWQPHYAEHGLATFPVGPNKTPAVRGYLKIGLDASRQLAIKFPANDAFGLACRRNRITVLDVDTNDERVLVEGLDQHGPTPFIVRSGSGNFQAWYRHNGERRKVRPDPEKPVDILGDGYVVCPPSVAAKGSYQIIQGRLEDLARLPKMRSQTDQPIAAVGNDNNIASQALVEKRNDLLWRYCMRAARQCAGIEQLMEVAMTENATAFYEPLPAEEVLKIVASACGYEVEGKNWFGYGKRVVFDADEVDDLASKEPRAFALLSILRRHHSTNETFVIAKGMAEKLNWAVNTLRSAREVLMQTGRIECVHPGGRRPNDPPRFKFKKGVKK